MFLSPTAKVPFWVPFTGRVHHTYLDLQLVADGQSRVLQRFDDRRVRVGELGVLPHQGDGALLQQPVRPAGAAQWTVRDRLSDLTLRFTNVYQKSQAGRVFEV